MRGVNKAILIGYVGKDPEMRYTQSGVAVCTFSIATTEKWTDKNTGEMKEDTQWHNIVAWRKVAEIAGEWVKKGMPLYIEGKIVTRSYEKDGVKKYMTEIVVDVLNMLGTKAGSGSGSDDVPEKEAVGAVKAEEDLPF